MNRIRRYLVTAAVLFAVATGYSLWRASCTAGCSMSEVVLGYPVFLKTPFSPDSPGGPQFLLLPFLINIIWTAAASVVFWAIIETFGRWNERRQQPPPF
jgi:hypothetical protein